MSHTRNVVEKIMLSYKRKQTMKWSPGHHFMRQTKVFNQMRSKHQGDKNKSLLTTFIELQL